MPSIKIKNTDFYYELHGKGHPLILVSGYAADHQFWMPVLPALAERFQVLIFDNRAIGRTQDRGQFPLTAEMMADDVMALGKVLSLHQPHVVGQSMGGTIVQSLAARYGKEISKVAILNSTTKWRRAMLLGLKTMISLRKEKVSFDTYFECVISWVFGEAFLQDAKKVDHLRSLFIKNPYPPSIEDQERQYAALVEFDGREALRQITAPTLVVYGTEDVISLPYESKAIAAGIANAELVELNCGHGITNEIPEVLGELLLRFFA